MATPAFLKPSSSATLSQSTLTGSLFSMTMVSMKRLSFGVGLNDLEEGPSLVADPVAFWGVTVEAGPAPAEVGPAPAPAPETGLGPKRLLPEAGELIIAVWRRVGICL